jgi:NitT/TauT family transport system substrate-binding protein
MQRFRKVLSPVYGDPAYAKQVARKEFPDLDGAGVDKAIDAQLKYKIPAESVVVDRAQWDTLMAMRKYLGNLKGTTTFDQIVDNSFAEKAKGS